jgi:hypothetical protein
LVGHVIYSCVSSWVPSWVPSWVTVWIVYGLVGHLISVLWFKPREEAHLQREREIDRWIALRRLG